MAPSSRTVRVAPSLPLSTTTAKTSVSRSTRTQKASLQDVSQVQLLKNGAGFGRVTKSRVSRVHAKLSGVEKGAVERWCEDGTDKENEGGQEEVCEEIVCVEIASEVTSLKRKRSDVGGSDSESGGGSQSDRVLLKVREQNKKRRFQGRNQLLSPPTSRDGADYDEKSPPTNRLTSSPKSRCLNASLQSLVELPSSLLDLISLHGAFLKALSLYYAHNGVSSPAELMGLMDSTTRLWRKQSIRKEIVQQMLGLYELASDSALLGEKCVEQRRSPFRIVTAGLGSNVRTNIEYTDQAPYSEVNLQTTFSDMVHTCFQKHASIEDMATIPLLTVTLGAQTATQRTKASSTRMEILSLSAAAQSRSNLDFSKLSLIDLSDCTPASIKSRTLSLFDRVRAKGLASLNNAAPTPEQIARRHALGRISEIVEFLRMKQQQKLSIQLQMSGHSSLGSIRGSGKVSFSLGAIVRDVQQSVGVPIGEEEIRTCLKMLSQELPGEWCHMIALGSIMSITLQGPGVSGLEAKRYFERQSPLV